MKPLAIFLMGPTASGKTELALRLCDRLPCEIISVDSALVYRGMDIGTAKPDVAILRRYPHQLVDILDPSEVYSAADFRRDALEAMRAITARGHIPLLVGGTMLYFKALLEGLAPMPTVDPAIRAAIEQEAAERGWPALHAELAGVDPALAATIHPHHSQRISRALEVYRASGVTMSEWRQRQQQQELPYRVLQFALATPDRAELHRRIERRLRAMFDSDFVEEVRALHARGDLSEDLPAVRAVGYRQVWEYLEERIGTEEMFDRALAATRQLAKRQLTWLRKWPDLCWLDLEIGLEATINQVVSSVNAAEFNDVGL